MEFSRLSPRPKPDGAGLLKEKLGLTVGAAGRRAGQSDGIEDQSRSS